jgi:hypothetical protein
MQLKFDIMKVNLMVVIPLCLNVSMDKYTDFSLT